MSLNRVCGKLQRCQTLGRKRKTKKKMANVPRTVGVVSAPLFYRPHTTGQFLFFAASLSLASSIPITVAATPILFICRLGLSLWPQEENTTSLTERSLTTSFLLLSLAGLLPLFSLIVFCIVP